MTGRSELAFTTKDWLDGILWIDSIGDRFRDPARDLSVIGLVPKDLLLGSSALLQSAKNESWCGTRRIGLGFDSGICSLGLFAADLACPSLPGLLLFTFSSHESSVNCSVL